MVMTASDTSSVWTEAATIFWVHRRKLTVILALQFLVSVVLVRGLWYLALPFSMMFFVILFWYWRKREPTPQKPKLWSPSNRTGDDAL